jgi:hypothetical protein
MFLQKNNPENVLAKVVIDAIFDNMLRDGRGLIIPCAYYKQFVKQEDKEILKNLKSDAISDEKVMGRLILLTVDNYCPNCFLFGKRIRNCNKNCTIKKSNRSNVYNFKI